MDINSKLKAEEGNYSSIVIYGDGSKFVRMYERSAFAFLKVFNRKLMPVFVERKDGKAYLYTGFLAESLKAFTNGCKLSTDKPDDKTTVHVIRTSDDTFSEEEYQTWWRVSKVEWMKAQAAKGKAKGGGSADSSAAASGDTSAIAQSIPAETPAAAPSEPDQHSLTMASFNEAVINDIMGLHLAEFTPMAALNYLNQLQQRINDGRQQQQQ